MGRQVYVYSCLGVYAYGLPLYFHDLRGEKGMTRRRVGGGGRMQSEGGGASERGGR